MQKKAIAMLLCLAVTAGIVTSCDHDDPSTETYVSTSSAADTGNSSEHNYKTMEPPEGGWTIEDILSVTYLCGKQLSYPLTFESLGEGFSIGDAYPSGVAEVLTVDLNYDDKKIGSIIYTGINDIKDWNSELPICDLDVGGRNCEIDDPIVLNSIHIGDNKESLIEALGKQDKINDIGNLVYQLNDKESRLSITINNEDSISNFYFNDIINDTAVTMETAQQSSETEFKTMERPEGGWTIEDILSVTYLCGKQLSYPLTFESLGDGFSIGEAYPSGVAEVLTVDLQYNDKTIGSMIYTGINDIKDWNSELSICDIVIRGQSGEIDDPIVLNGIHMGDNKESLIDALGKQDEINDIGNLVYKLNDKESRLSITINNEDAITNLYYNDVIIEGVDTPMTNRSH